MRLHYIGVAFVCALALSWPAHAQENVEFLTRYNFHLDAARIGAGDDERFQWDADFGGDLDVVRWGGTRATFLANYEVVLGGQLRRFDPNQGNYTLAGSVMTRVGGLEIGGLFHHVSRHLSDRSKQAPIDWNMLGVRVQKDSQDGPVGMDTRVDVRRVLKKSDVDYVWEIDAAVATRFALQPRVAVIYGVGLRHLGVDGTRARGAQTGFRSEGGLRFQGTAGAMEVFVATERRIDPIPLVASVDTWVTMGFRLTH